MPELPEVETTRRGIAPHIVGQRVHDVVVRNHQLRWPIPGQLRSELIGRFILRVDRRGKYLLLQADDACLLVHLGMSGSLRVVAANDPILKHDHVDLVMANGSTLRYSDPRRFGCMLWLTGSPMEHPLLKSLGPEPLSDDFDGNTLLRSARGRKVPVKSFIMDSHVVVGVGNIYANEALFMAGIRPDRAAGRISVRRYVRLAECIKEVLGRAITQGGTTLRDFVGGDGKPGYFKQSLHVYGRGGEACSACNGALTETRIGQRSTVFCPRCQR
ncbi:MAG: bifunctional DNA-formamidopyrimidine glycosylase/DNA-(apurinic or apyrimidinic site) lyase [Gammaproteobacteria bacterium]|nr:bifunctional DNA-formamidopyrimidine glycosylase/DNA-(apurinic or apyrimidinic site) lyase [Gammaproteobacteria bacterium]MDP2139535.1 bifunctional DNA-formamidopyrimidine glycosylase/DNA-(apurinic or apyrimidinic site) lyase [Gammaproteobacteria bacterium]MDP2346508.1 bifunctional DNA-formamidopyrimidine glycosylase/DNA-(apurinic or apyrimidinic site) lyase [Gammaproteobacteria bacterium]